MQYQNLPWAMLESILILALLLFLILVGALWKYLETYLQLRKNGTQTIPTNEWNKKMFNSKIVSNLTVNGKYHKNASDLEF